MAATLGAHHERLHGTGDQAAADWAATLLHDVIADLRGTAPSRPDLPAAQLEPPDSASRARSGAVLAEVLLADLAVQTAGHPDGAAVVAVTAAVLHQRLLDHVRDGAERYIARLLNEVREACASERSRISHELHDRLGHSLSAAYRNLEAYDVARERGVDRPDLREVVLTELREAHEFLRSFAQGLHLAQPQGPLREALGRMQAVLGLDGTRIVTEVNGDERWAEPEVVDEVYLVVREALRNAVAHAGASLITARVDISPQALRATVTDDGIGFDPHAPGNCGLGLSAMNSRAAGMGGSLTVGRACAGGTRVELVVPLAGPATGLAR